MKRNDRHAVYGITADGVAFRIGLPTSWDRAVARWYRLDDQRFKDGRVLRVRHERRWYRIRTFEVRAVDRHGLALGSERHKRAIPVPYRAANAQPGKRRPLALRIAPASARI